MSGKSRLGKGLGALFPSLPGEQAAEQNVSDAVVKTEEAGLTVLPAEEITPVNQHVPQPADVNDANDNQHAPTSQRSSMTSKRSGKRASIPSLDTMTHPSDLFFGTTTPTPQMTQTVADDTHTEHVSRETSSSTEELKPVQGGYLAELPVDCIVPNAHQPRTIFDEDELRELSDSIAEVGVLQPIVVRHQHGDVYELVMGERRWRATKLAGLSTIPAIVKTTTDNDMLRDALLENLHRVALNPLEEAAAYQQMIDEFGLTQGELAKSVSKSRPQIANTLRLLHLPPTVQKQVASGMLSAGHARALLALPTESDMDALAHRIIAEGLSVRSTEEIVALQLSNEPQKKRRRAGASNPWSGTPIQRSLEDRFETKVSIKGTPKHGRIEIVFSSQEDMDRIMKLLVPDGASSAPSDE